MYNRRCPGKRRFFLFDNLISRKLYAISNKPFVLNSMVHGRWTIPQMENFFPLIFPFG